MEEYTQNDCIRDTKEHISQVRFFMIQFAQELLKRSLIHDDSKLESPEIELFTEYTPKLRGTNYGSEEYDGFLDGMKKALDHHYRVNTHHPEHYKDGIKGMNLLDIVEMLCDWKASTMRQESGNIRLSIDINKERFEIGDCLYNVLKNTLDDMKW